MNPITAIIVDDHAAFRRSLRKFVQTIGNIEVVGEAADGQIALDLTIKLRPQLVLMDICMPQLNGTDACRAMKQDNATLSVVLYSADLSEIERAVAQDAANFCLNKDCLFDKLPAWIGETFTFSQRRTCRINAGRRGLLPRLRRTRPSRFRFCPTIWIRRRVFPSKNSRHILARPCKSTILELVT